MMPIMTQEQIDSMYNASVDSIKLVQELSAKASLTTEDRDAIKRNIDHLRIMIAKPEMVECKDMKPFRDAITLGTVTLRK